MPLLPLSMPEQLQDILLYEASRNLGSSIHFEEFTDIQTVISKRFFFYQLYVRNSKVSKQKFTHRVSNTK